MPPFERGGIYNDICHHPRRERARAVIASWFSGNVSGRVLAEILAGKTNPSGRLPVTFYGSIDQTPHPILPGFGTPMNTPAMRASACWDLSGSS